METSLQFPAKSQVPARTELTALKTGNQFQEARRAKKIATCSIEEIREVFRFILALVGMKRDNLPIAEEKDILINFLLQNYGNHTDEEVRLAFDMALARRLDLEEDQVSHYQNFSCEYIGRIMAAYRRWAVKEHALLPWKPMKPTAAQLGWEADWKSEANEAYAGFLAGKLIFRLMPSGIHNQLVKDGLTSEARQAIRSELVMDRGSIGATEIGLVSKQLAIVKLFSDFRSISATEIYGGDGKVGGIERCKVDQVAEIAAAIQCAEMQCNGFVPLRLNEIKQV